MGESKVVGRELGEMGKDLLAAEEVASYLGLNPVTVYRWCRQGKLPGLRIGRYWRIRREALDDFLRQSEQPTTLLGHLRAFVKVPDNVIAIADNSELLHRLDAAFFMLGESHGGTLIKFHGGEEVSEDNLRADLEDWGLEVERLEDEGRLRFIAEENPEEREALLKHHLEENSADGSTLWASFDWSKQMSLERALKQQEAISKITSGNLVVNTVALEEAIDDWPPAILRRAQVVHSGQIWLSGKGISVSRVAPLPDP
jgi:excisionase family DNA binding protein